MVCAPEGPALIKKFFPDVRIIFAVEDEKLNAKNLFCLDLVILVIDILVPNKVLFLSF
jgi:hypothetical protein